LAHLTLIYPLITLGALYGEWMLAWLVLGHRPVPWMNDPKDILGGFAHLLTMIVFLGALPAALGGAVVNLIWVVDYKGAPIIGVTRLLLFWTLWLALLVILKWDPLTIGKWWID
jgi:hypothetical protein